MGTRTARRHATAALIGLLIILPRAAGRAAEAPGRQFTSSSGETCHLMLRQCVVVTDAFRNLIRRTQPLGCDEARAYVEKAGAKGDEEKLRVQEVYSGVKVDPGRDCVRVTAGRADDDPGCRLNIRQCLLFWQVAGRGVMGAGWFSCDWAKAYAARKNREDPASKHRFEEVQIETRIDVAKDCKSDFGPPVPAAPSVPGRSPGWKEADPPKR